MAMHTGRRRQLVMLGCSAVAFLLWQMGVLEGVVLSMATLMGLVALLALITGASSGKAALVKMLGWLERRLTG